MPTVDRPQDSGSPPPTSGGWPRALTDLAMLAMALVAWGCLLSGLWGHPAEIALLALSVPILACVGRGIELWLGRAWGSAGILAMGMLGFAALVLLTGASPTSLAGFMLGLVKPVGWRGDHLLLRVVPLAMLMAHPRRPSWPGALVSALGVSAFLGITLLILHAAG